MKLSVLEKILSDQIAARIRDVTPGVMARAYQGGKLVVDIAVGETWPYYDLASLTKIIFTVQTLMLDYEKKRWSLESRVSDFLSWYPHPQVLIRDLLTHSAGYEWWRPFYKDIDYSKDLAARRKQLSGMIAEIPLQKNDLSVYSDLDFFVLGDVLEEMHQKPLWEIWANTKSTFYDGTTLDFHVNNICPHRHSRYAPTEECPWRKRMLQGEVHDENAWALGGISTHAGLFGSIDDLGWYLLNLRSQLFGIGRTPVHMKTAKIFSVRARPEGKGDWALGFMMPTPGMASCGSYFNFNSLGHTGFTGTSLWYDPTADLGIAILSNRVMYGRENKSFQLLRPEIHNWIVEGLRKSSY